VFFFIFMAALKRARFSLRGWVSRVLCSTTLTMQFISRLLTWAPQGSSHLQRRRGRTKNGGKERIGRSKPLLTLAIFASLIIYIFQLFLVETVFFSYNKSVGTIFCLFFQRSERDIISCIHHCIDCVLGKGTRRANRILGSPSTHPASQATQASATRGTPRPNVT